MVSNALLQSNCNNKGDFSFVHSHYWCGCHQWVLRELIECCGTFWSLSEKYLRCLDLLRKSTIWPCASFSKTFEKTRNKAMGRNSEGDDVFLKCQDLCSLHEVGKIPLASEALNSFARWGATFPKVRSKF